MGPFASMGTIAVVAAPTGGTDHIKAEDLRQASVVMAGMLLAAANSDKELPRPPLPRKPLPTDPFEYKYPKDR